MASVKNEGALAAGRQFGKPASSRRSWAKAPLPVARTPDTLRAFMSTRSAVKIYDTTLRDGTQGEGISFSVTDKLLITQRLDEFGVDYI